MSNDEELAALRKLARAVARHGELDERARVVFGCGELIDMAKDALKFDRYPEAECCPPGPGFVDDGPMTKEAGGRL